MAIIIACIVALVVGYEIFINSKRNEIVMNIESKEEVKEGQDTIEVYVVGCVEKPGVYEVLKGTTVEKVAKEAGGFTKDADLERINLVHKLKDNVMLEIKSKSERLSAELNNESNKKVQSMKIIRGVYEDDNREDVQVNINTATKQRLSKLPGIGNSVAEKIIRYREENGEFESVEDLKNISGIGESKFNNIKDMLIV